jgi:hypothetical protein
MADVPWHTTVELIRWEQHGGRSGVGERDRRPGIGDSKIGRENHHLHRWCRRKFASISQLIGMHAEEQRKGIYI